MEKLLTIDDVCQALTVRKSTLYQWINMGIFPYIKVGRLIRFKEKEIENWLEKREKNVKMRLPVNKNGSI